MNNIDTWQLGTQLQMWLQMQEEKWRMGQGLILVNYLVVGLVLHMIDPCVYGLMMHA